MLALEPTPALPEHSSRADREVRCRNCTLNLETKEEAIETRDVTNWLRRNFFLRTESDQATSSTRLLSGSGIGMLHHKSETGFSTGRLDPATSGKLDPTSPES